MVKIMLFGGTSEARALSEYLNACGAKHNVYVATDYGAELLENIDTADVRAGRLGVDELAMLFAVQKLCGDVLVIDAAHPYAAELHKNLKIACGRTTVEYMRLLRPSVSVVDGIECADHKAAVDYLNKTEGTVLLTTGSKNIAEYTAINSFGSRIYARILPEADALRQCAELGFAKKNIIAMQGPFTKEMNAALMRSVNAKYIVTKDTGQTGGFIEKIEAAKECGVKVVVVARPSEETGLTLDALKCELAERFAIEKHTAEPQLDAFPVFIPIRGKKVLIVGGGKVAERRTAVLLEFGAEVTVVSPAVTEKIMEYARAGRISLLMSKLMDSYIDNAYKLIITATNDRKVNKRAGLIAKKLGILVSVADSHTESDFHFPAVVTGAGVVSGVISEGACDHKLVKETAEKLRQVLRTEK